MEKEDVLKKLQEIKPELKEKYAVSELGLFGSYSRGDYDQNSDIDILVEYSEVLSLFTIIDIIEYLQKIFNKKVDLVNKKNIKELIKDRILNEAIYI